MVVEQYRFKISIDSTNSLSMDYLDDISISVTTTEATTDILDIGDNLEVDDVLSNKLFD